MYYKCKDYTARMEIINDCERYFIEFHGQVDSPAVEVSLDIFNEYYKEFSKPMERQRNEKRRHIKGCDFDEVIVIVEEDNLAFKYSIEAALKTCTPIQQERFDLHYVQGYSLTEIAEMENCAVMSVKESITVASKKIKKYFS